MRDGGDAVKGRWAAGIMPRNFAWIVKDRLAVSERPGGYAPHHRRVRRQEEILWLEAQGFTRVVSLLPSSHNLHAYEELGLPPQGDVRDALAELYPALLGWIRDGERVLVHQEELGERVAGVVAGFLCWCGLLPDPPRAIYAVEQLLRRQLGSAGRAIVAVAPTLPPPPRVHAGPAGGLERIGGPEYELAADDAAAGGTDEPGAGPAGASAGPEPVVAPVEPRGARPGRAQAPARSRRRPVAPGPGET